jgi:hypothetical protein
MPFLRHKLYCVFPCSFENVNFRGVRDVMLKRSHCELRSSGRLRFLSVPVRIAERCNAEPSTIRLIARFEVFTAVTMERREREAGGSERHYG